MRSIVCLLLGVASLSACAVVGAGPPDASQSPGGEPQRTVDIVGVFGDVEYHGACGNETVTVDGVTYYPQYYADVLALDPDRYPAASVDVRSVTAGANVMPPGPGEDVGTLIAYGDGVARFESYGGRSVWLTATEQVYGWDC